MDDTARSADSNSYAHFRAGMGPGHLTFKTRCPDRSFLLSELCQLLPVLRQPSVALQSTSWSPVPS